MARRGRQSDEIKHLIEVWQIVVTASPLAALGTYSIKGVLAANASKVLSTHGATAYGTDGVVFTAPRSAYYRFLVRTSFDWRVAIPNGYYRLELVLNGNVATYSEFIGASVYQFDAFTNPLYLPVIGEQIIFMNAGETAYPALANIVGAYGSVPDLGPTWIEIDSVTDSRRVGSF